MSLTVEFFVTARLASGERVFETIIRTQLLDNPHRTTVLLTADPAAADAWVTSAADSVQRALLARGQLAG